MAIFPNGYEAWAATLFEVYTAVIIEIDVQPKVAKRQI